MQCKVPRLARGNDMWGLEPPGARVSATHGPCVEVARIGACSALIFLREKDDTT